MKNLFLIIISVFIISNILHGQYSPAALDSFILGIMDKYHFPGLQACIVKGDQIFWKGNYGYADIEQNKMVDDSTLFILESISKPVTATALMQLWEKDLFELDDDVNKYLPFEVRNPSFPNDSITFRMLLSHSSSITENWTIYPSLNDLVTFGGDSPISLRFFLENYLIQGGAYYTANSWDYRAPGSAYNYSSRGIDLLGYLVEILADTSFEDYCQENIFRPLEMYKTSWFLANLDINKIATPYVYSGGKYNPYDHWGVPGYPNCQIRTSALQLARFLMTFIQKGQVYKKRILESSTVDSMTTIQNPQLYHCGLTWFVSEHNLPHNIGIKTTCGHTGSRRFGANTGMAFILNEDIGAIILTNGDYGDAEPGIVELAFELFSYGIINTTTDVENKKSVFPTKYYLSQNYPNPFNPKTMINYELPITNYVDLSIYNLLGQKVATLVDKKQPAGSYQVQWEAGGFASGIYIYRLKAKGQQQNAVFTKKLVLLK